MSLKEKTLFGIENKVNIAIEFLRDIEPEEGFYVADSGGKDSCVILKLVDMAGVKYDAHHNLTTIDPPELIYFLRDHHKNTIIDKPAKPFLTALIKNGFPRRQTRWCCREYKEQGGAGRLVVTGVRAAESKKRAKRSILEVCYKDASKRFAHIIFNWTEDEVWEFIHKYEIPYCPLYDDGWARIGCLFCPMAGDRRQRDAVKYPGYKNAFIKAFIKLYNKRKAEGNHSVDRWESGEAMFEWWINEDKEEDKRQMRFFYGD